MATDWLSRLPLELILIILSQIPVPSLVSFGATSKRNQIFHVLCMRKLHLAIFHKRVHANIAFLDACTQRDTKESESSKQSSKIESHQIPVVLPESAFGLDVTDYKRQPPLSADTHQYKVGKRSYAALLKDRELKWLPSVEQTIRAQNERFAQIISQYGESLLDLVFMAYDINTEGAIALSASCGSKLRHLALRFEHPHIRDSMLGRSYWMKPAPGSPAWNALIGVGSLGKGIGMSNLESLVLERAGITSWQLRMLVKRNQKLRTLKLKTCAAVQPEFVNWLGGIDIPECEGETPRRDGEAVPGALLKVLWLENCDDIRSNHNSSSQEDEFVDTGLEWVGELKELQSLSFRDCRNMDPKAVEWANLTLWHIPEVLLPRPIGLWYSSEVVIEVDPQYI